MTEGKGKSGGGFFQCVEKMSAKKDGFSNLWKTRFAEANPDQEGMISTGIFDFSRTHSLM